ncbi:MAG: DUF1559 domain-containing protein, partial [Planctomycetes bacterium]|nr:DUF1559 domain-containing protein [Planctomycetota bacterium]
PKMVAIISDNNAFDKSVLLKKGGKTVAADPNGFYKVEPDMWFHFPDDKTLVLVSPDLAPKYLAGYAKDRSGWPLTADLTRAASGNTVFAAVNVQKVPREMLTAAGDKFSALAATQKVVVTANLRGKELSLGVRASYADAATATKAKEQAQATLDMAAGLVGMAANGKEMAELTSLKPAVQEVQRAVKAAKIEVSGSDLTLAASYKADFDIGQVITDAVKKIRASAARMTAQNNLKQIGLGLHNYESANGRVPVYGVGANGALLLRPTDKPLLSWRVAILPYIEQGELYKQFKLDEPWDGPNNKKLIEQMPKIFAPTEKAGKAGYTHLQMVVGPGAMQPWGAQAIVGITDGTSNTIAVAEAADPVVWTKPDDVTLPAKLAPGELKRKFGGQFPGGFNVVMWDGSTRFVKDTVSERNLALAINPRDGQVLPFDWDNPGSPK